MDCGMWADDTGMRAAANTVGPATACVLKNAVYSILQDDVPASCAETAAGANAVDTAACAAVTDLADATVCAAVDTAASQTAADDCEAGEDMSPAECEAITGCAATKVKTLAGEFRRCD
jgi:hypothetical protein